MRTWVLPLLFIALAGCAEAQTPPDDLIEVADGRAPGDYEGLSAWEGHAAVRAAMAAARAHWRAQDADYDEDARVMAIAEGAFTRAGAEQQAVLYLMSLWPRCCPKLGLAVVEGGELVRNVAFEGVAQGLHPVPDLDGDGRDELAFVGTFGMGGSESTSLTLAAFAEADGLRAWGTADLMEGGCATGNPAYARASAVRVLAAPGPTFLAERYEDASCEGTWERTGEAEPLELYPPGAEGGGYVDLPLR